MEYTEKWVTGKSIQSQKGQLSVYMLVGWLVRFNKAFNTIRLCCALRNAITNGLFHNNSNMFANWVITKLPKLVKYVCYFSSKPHQSGNWQERVTETD